MTYVLENVVRPLGAGLPCVERLAEGVGPLVGVGVGVDGSGGGRWERREPVIASAETAWPMSIRRFDTDPPEYDQDGSVTARSRTIARWTHAP